MKVSTKLAPALVVAILVLLIGFTALRQSTDKADRQTPADPIETHETSASSRSSSTSQANNTSTTPEPEGAFFNGPEEEWRGRGIIHLKMVDDLTGEPVPGLRFVVFSERPRNHILGRGRADETGSIYLIDLPEDPILIQSERKPPYCSTLDAIWLPEGASIEREFRVLRGGTIRGRVIDETGESVAGATIKVSRPTRYPLKKSNEPNSSTNVKAPNHDEHPSTDEDGFFELRHVMSEPRGVWVVDDAPRPQYWSPVRFTIELGQRRVRQSTQIDDGDLRDLGEIVLPNLKVLRGTVVDGDDRPIEGALVSFGRSPQRRRTIIGSHQNLSEQTMLGPGSAGFEVQKGECLTDALGHFDITCPTNAYRIVAMRSTNDFQSFPIRDAISSKEHSLVLKLENAASYTLEFFDQKGKLSHDRLAEAWTRASRSGRMYFGGFGFMVQATAKLQSAESRATNAFRSPEDQWSVRFSGIDANAVATLVIRVPGYRPTRMVAPSSNNSPIRVDLAAVPSHSLKLLVQREADSSTPEDKPQLYTLRACLAEGSLVRQTLYECCGLGALTRVSLQSGEAKETTLDVAHPGPFWIEVVRASPMGFFIGEDTKPRRFGPFTAAEDAYELLVVDSDFPTPKPHNRFPQAKPSTEPPPPSRPRDREEQDNVQIAVNDSSTGEPLDISAIRLSFVDENQRTQRRQPYRAPGLDLGIFVTSLPRNTQTIILSANKYRETEPIPVSLGVELITRLGPFSLEPIPRLVLRILDSNGDPAPSDTTVSVWNREQAFACLL